MGSTPKPLACSSAPPVSSGDCHKTKKRMDNYLGRVVGEVAHAGLAQNGLENLPCPSSLLLGVLVTLLPKMVPRLMPYFLGSASAEVKSRFSNPQDLAATEELFREKFIENLKIVEDVVMAAEDNTLERKSQDYTGFKRFLFGSLEALDINVSDYIGGLEVRSVQRLTRIAQGEDSMSGLYNVITDGIMAVSSFIFNNYLLVD